MGETAENVAERFAIPRQDQDVFACRSQAKAAAAQGRGRFEREIVAVEVAQRRGDPRVVDADEFIRPNTTLDGLAKLRPAFKSGGSVTAGNSSGINDGASALLVASENAIRTYDLKPLARVVTSAVAGVEPRVMGLGPVPSSRKALEQAEISLKDVDVIEINEAFAAQVLGCLREFGLPADEPRLNPNGGAIALGHPLGMSGARLLLTAAHELKETGGRYALATMCVGVGQGMATVLERV
jgi:3-oxo-5,6-didehydrosuberyl-CoA/3-oxoadipyl-CoA thiolase